MYVTDRRCMRQISLVSLGAEGAGLGNMGAFRALRTFRALRPLRAVSRWEGMKASRNSLTSFLVNVLIFRQILYQFYINYQCILKLEGGHSIECITHAGQSIVFNVFCTL